MDAARFDQLIRSLPHGASRRDVWRGLAATLLVMSVAHLPTTARARKRKQPLKRNAFGCVNVGKACRGKDSVCCSGICQGKKPKKGEKDRSQCVAHNVGGCTLAREICFTVDPAVSQCNAANPNASCATTTGNAPFCGDFGPPLGPSCQSCQRDPDCLAFGYPPGSACVLLNLGACSTCKDSTAGRACMAPAV